MTFDKRLALVITQLALLILLVNEVLQLASANGKLSTALTGQRANDDTVKRINTQLDALARGTQRLARDGNPQAAAIVDQLARSGVRINDQTAPR